MLMCKFFEGGQSEKVYVLYTHLNVDNYGQPFSRKTLIPKQTKMVVCGWKILFGKYSTENM